MNDYLKLLRPTHWSKNVFVFAGLVFAEQNLLFDLAYVLPVVTAFLCFCASSSVAYIVNDIMDADQDRSHPIKKNRPIAARRIPVRNAAGVAGLLAILALGGSAMINWLLVVVTAGYLVLNLLYSLRVKNYVIADVMCIAIGFVLRALGGVVAIRIPLSPWLIVCTFTLCLFLGFGKRRCEIAMWGDDRARASNHRPVLLHYSLELLGHLLGISAAVAVVSFLLYTMDPQTAAKFGTNYLIYTTPLVIYGIFRFAVLIETGQVTGPVDIITADRPFQITVLLWAVMAFVIVHWGPDIKQAVAALQ